MDFDPSSAQPLDFDPSSATEAPAAPRDVPRPMGMAEPNPPKAERGGIMGAIDKALGVAEVFGTMLTAGTSGMARGTADALVNSAHITMRKLTGRDTSDIASPGDAFEQGMGKGTYTPRTEEGKDTLQGPVMREIGHIATALGPAGTPVNVARGSVSNAGRAVNDARRSATAGVAAKVADVITPNIDPQKVQLARKAVDAGIPLRPDMLTDNKLVRIAGEAAENIPLTGSKKEARKTEFNKNVVRLIDDGSDAPKLTPEVYAEAMDKNGATIGEIMARTDTPHDAFGDLTTVARRETPDVQGVVKTYAEDLQAIAAQHGGIVPGDRLRKLRTEAQAQARTTSNGDLKRTLHEFVNKLDEAFGERAPEADIPALAEARRRYAVGVALEPLVAKSTTGDITPASLMGAATANKAGKNRMARGKGGEMGDLARIGQAFLKEQASSNTAERNAVYKLATDAATAAAAVGKAPFAAAYNLLGPRVARHMLEAAERRQGPKRAPDVPTGPAPLELADGPIPPRPDAPAPAGPLGDLTPEWETAPGAGRPATEGLDPTGLVPAIDEGAPLPQGVPQRPGSQIPLADGRPLGDTTPNWETSPGANGAGRLEVAPAEGLVPAVDEAVPLRPGPAAPAVRRGAGSEIPAVPGRPDLPDTMIAGAPAEVAGDAATGAAMQTPEAQLAMRTQQTGRNVAAAAAERAQPVPVGEATEIKPQVVEPAGSPKVKEPPVEKLPVGEATEIKPEQATPASTPPKTDERLAGLERLRASAENDTVRKVIDKRINAVKKEIADETAAAKRRDDAAELRRTAATTEDADLKAALFEEAKKLEKAESVPAGKTIEGQPEIKTGAPKELPKPKVIEGQPEIKVKTPEKKLPTPEVKELDGKGDVLADLDLPRLDEAFMAEQQRVQRAAEPKVDPQTLERGRRQTRAAIEKGKADGTLGADEADLALWALDKNPNLARGLRFEMSTNGEKDAARAVYNTISRVVQSFTNKASDPQRAVHEILHHSERMMPPEVQRGIRREWRAAVDAAIKKASPEEAEALGKILKGMNGGKEEFEAMKAAFRDGVLDRSKHYHLTNPSEFWAVNASRILAERHAGRNSWRREAVTFLREMVEKVKGTVGLRSDAAVLKALNEVMDSTKNAGVDRSTNVLKTAEVQATLADRIRANKASTTKEK